MGQKVIDTADKHGQDGKTRYGSSMFWSTLEYDAEPRLGFTFSALEILPIIETAFLHREQFEDLKYTC